MKRAIIIVVLMAAFLKNCSWTTNGIYIVYLEEYEKNMLCDVFGEDIRDDLESGKITNEQLRVLDAYNTGGQHILDHYYRLKYEVTGFKVVSDTLYVLTFEYDGKEYECTVEESDGAWIVEDTLQIDQDSLR